MMDSAEKMWQEFHQQKGTDSSKEVYEAWSFGNTPEMADDLLALVKEGLKTGTSSLENLYALDNDKIPETLEYSVILDGQNRAGCIVQTIKIERFPFKDATEEHGYLEGEGDRSLAYWRKVHQDFFTQELNQYSLEFDDNFEVVYEHFVVVYNQKA